MKPVIFLLISLATGTTGMKQVRVDFHAITHESDLDRFIRNYENATLKKAIPYVACAIMRKAEYTFLPTNKLRYFNHGKKQLERYITENPNDIEGRYIRFLVQHRVPGFLGYRHNIVSDKNYIMDHLAFSDLPESYKKRIVNDLNRVK